MRSYIERNRCESQMKMERILMTFDTLDPAMPKDNFPITNKFPFFLKQV